MSLKNLIANMRHAAWVRQAGAIGSGEYTPDELGEAASQIEALQTQLEAAKSLLERINTAFYVEGTTKALRPVMAETKPMLQAIRAALTKVDTDAR